LAIDRTGSVVVIELKRDRLPREALAQAIDYAADIATWSLDKLGEVCASYCGETLEDVLSNAFPDIDLEGLTINGAQRIALVGFALDPALERMIEWLSEAYGVAINAVVLKYIRTANGAEILTRSAVISEEGEEAAPREGSSRSRCPTSPVRTRRISCVGSWSSISPGTSSRLDGSGIYFSLSACSDRR